MTLNEFLDYKLLDLENYQITVFRVGLVALILTVTYVGLKIIKRAIEKPKSSLPFDKGRRQSLYLIINYFIWVVCIAACLQAIGIKITILLAGSAALLVGLGLGIQQIFNDIVSGMFLLFEGSVQIGDVMEVDGIVCQVREIKLRTSKVKTRDDIIVIIPNHKFINENVINWSHQQKTTRFSVDIGVSYKSDPEQVSEILIGVMKDHKSLIKTKEKAPVVRFTGFGDSSLNFIMLFYSSETFHIESVMSDLRFAVFKRFREEGVEIPFPQRDIHLRSSDVNMTPFDRGV